MSSEHFPLFPQLPLSPSSSFSALSLSPPSPGGLAWALSKAQPKSAIPGPTGLPILGLVFAFTSSLTHRLLSTLAKSHDAGMTRFIISSDPDTAKETLNSPVFATHLFSPKSINGFGPGRKEIGLKMVNEIKGLMVEKGVVDVKRVLHFGSLNNVMMSVFGRCYEFGGKDGAGDGLELEGLVREGYELLGMFNWSDHFPVLCWLDLQGVRRRCREFVGRVNVFVGKIIEEHRLKRAENGGVVGDESSGDFVEVGLEGAFSGFLSLWPEGMGG